MMRQEGFTYLLALFAVAVVGLTAMKAMPVIEAYEQREKEDELLYIGQQFRQAIASYYNGTPGTLKRYPAKLEDLLADRRFVGVKRHLRRIYIDPFTQKVDWEIVRDVDGGIIGIHSLHDRLPIKQDGFREPDADFAGAASYRDWRFVYRPVKINDVPARKAQGK